MNTLSIIPKNTDPLEKLINSDHPVLLRVLLETLRDDHATDTSQIAPLHRAVRLGIKEAVQSLLQFGADPNEKNLLGEIPLHVAVRINRADIVDILLPVSKVNSVSYYGLTPLHWACLFGYTSIVESLLLHGADPWIQAIEMDGLSPKDLAELMDYKDILSLFNNMVPTY
ncbi:MAG: ankyrin repeat domain-containing protein [Candidatus Hydrogenedens sp.]